ncbi:MAG: hypothetical protein J07HB67_02394 [halophilic archaeon J07HB67]|nr:MAG: hypothetical protein J07HB67_02394 [halophilic archaeon J07HB67]
MSDDDNRRASGDQLVSTRRRFCATAAAAVGVSVGGCLGGDDPVTETHAVDFDDPTTTQTPSGYGDETLARRTPDPSVLGQPGATAERRRGLATDRLVATRDGERVAVADFSLGLYESGIEREGFSYDLYWLWTAARTTTETVRLSEITTQVQLDDDAELTTYDVTNSYETGAEVFRSGTGTDDDEFGLRWQGETSDTVTATGHCVGKRTGERRPVVWKLSVTVA